MSAQSVDLILDNAQVLTMDEAYTRYEPGAVAITGEDIVAVGPSAEITAAYAAREHLDCLGRVLMPGLVNAHTHAPMTLLRGLADDLRLDVWLLGYIMPVERAFVSPELVRLGTSLACLELLRSGVTCFADMYYFEQEVAHAAAEAGLRVLAGQTVLRFPAPDASSWEEALQRAADLITEWREHPLVVPSVAPHAPYTCTPEILRACSELAVANDVPIHIHLAETQREVDDCRSAHAMPVIPFVKKQRLLDAKVLGAHCVHVDEGEMQTMARHKTGIAHNPSSNLKLASGFAPVTQMLSTGLAVGIGTDGPASNNDLDMFEELRLAALLAKGASGDPTALSARTTLAMATRIGATALHLDSLIGSLEPGKRADLLLLDLSGLHTTPHFEHDPEAMYARIVYAAKSSDVTDVMVNGAWLLKNRTLCRDNEAELLAEAQQLARRVDAFLIEREQSAYSKLVAIGGAQEQESFEVQLKVRLDDGNRVEAVLGHPRVEELYFRHYREYDTYLCFPAPEASRLRYREDELLDEQNEVSSVRARLTLLGPTKEQPGIVQPVLSRSRFIAPAEHSLRFYREYFKPASEIVVVKDRRRWRVLFKGTEFYCNLDRVDEPPLGLFFEVKSRTWSRQDAEHKARLAENLATLLGGKAPERVILDYPDLAEEHGTEEHGD